MANPLEVQQMGPDFSDEAVGFSQQAVRELSARKQNLGPDEQAEIDRQMEQVKEHMPDLLSSFDGVHDSAVGSHELRTAVSDRNADSVIAWANLMAEQNKENVSRTYFRTIATSMARFKDLQLESMWNFLEKLLAA